MTSTRKDKMPYFFEQRIIFGRFQGEPIEWRPLDESDDSLLLVSSHVLGVYRFDFLDGGQEEHPFTELDVFFEEEFSYDAFTSDEWEVIAEGPRCLDANEAKRYFSSDEERRCFPTAFAARQGICAVKAEAASWWLGSPGTNPDCTAIVLPNGRIFTPGMPSDVEDSVGYRPAILLRK